MSEAAMNYRLFHDSYRIPTPSRDGFGEEKAWNANSIFLRGESLV